MTMADWADVEQRIAKVVRVNLGPEDHGVFTCWVQLDYGNSMQGAGGYALDQPVEVDGKTVRKGAEFGMEFIMRLVRVFDVHDFADIVGKTCFAYISPSNTWSGKVIGLGPLPTERGEEFCFEALVNEYRE